MKTLRTKFLAALFPVLLSATVMAQTRPAARPASDKEDTVELSAFVVTGETDHGYVATSTLAGGRTKMELRDVAAQVLVFTSELMNDLGATNLEEALLYSGNVESYLDYSDTDAAGQGAFSNNVLTRSRGLGELSATRNGFSTLVKSDNYNVDRISIISGPNALLFGMGSTGGISDSGVNQANLRQVKGKASFRIDSEGSRRGTFDFNQPLIADKLALRVDALRDRTEYWMKPSAYKNDRLYLTLTLRPTRTTTIKFSSEWSDVVNQRAPAQFPSDAVSLWLDRGSVPYANSPTRAVAGTDPLFKSSGKTAIYAYGNVPAPGVVTYVNAVVPRTYNDIVAFPNTPTADIGVLPALRRPAVAPDDVNWNGLTRATAQAGSTKTATIEQRLSRSFSAELAFNQETVTNREGGLLANTGNGFGSPSYTINVDPNLKLADGATPNPNFGKFYVEGNGGVGYWKDRAEESRLTLSYDVKAAGRKDIWRWLGDHRLTAMGSVRESKRSNQGNQTMVVGNPSFITGANIANLRSNQRRLSARYYLDRVGSGNRFGPEVIQNTVFGPWTFVDPNTGNNFQVVSLDNPAGATNAPGLSRQRFLSRVLADTATLWDGRLVLLAGWRDDRTRTRGVLPEDALTDPVTRMFVPISEARYNSIWENFSHGQSMTYGAVVHPWTSKWLSLHYSRAANYSKPLAFYDPFDQLLLGAVGKGEDYGVHAEFLEGRLSGRLNFFRTAQVGLAGGNLTNFPIHAGYDVESAMEALNPSMPQMGMNGSRSQASYTDTLDTVANGLDFDLTANLTNNWRLFASVGRQRTVYSNAGAKLAAWFNARLPVWQSYPSWATALMPTGNLLIKDSFQTDVYNVYYYSLALKNGRLVDNQREWRTNFTTNYRFTSGPLEAWTVGGGARYRSRARIGYPLMTVKASNGQAVSTSDFEHPYYTADEITWDAMLRYRLKLHGRMTCDLQLNVRNVFDANRVAGASALSTGVGVRYFSQEPRTATLQTSFEF